MHNPRLGQISFSSTQFLSERGQGMKPCAEDEGEGEGLCKVLGAGHPHAVSQDLLPPQPNPHTPARCHPIEYPADG
jgi:hypothetical protein